MAGAPVDRIPLHTIILPVLGMAAWLLVGKVGLEPLALVLVAVLLGNVIAAVHHAEMVALRVGEPFGTLVFALAVTVIEVGLIVSLMLGGEPNPTLLRDTVHAVVMLVLHGLAGLCIVVGAFRQRESEFRVEGANAFLAVLMPMAILVLVLPNHLISVPGPAYSPLQLAFVATACLGLYVAFLFIQTNWHRAYFLPVGEEDVDGACATERPDSDRVAWPTGGSAPVGRAAGEEPGAGARGRGGGRRRAARHRRRHHRGHRAAAGDRRRGAGRGAQPACRQASTSHSAARWPRSGSPCRRSYSSRPGPACRSISAFLPAQAC